MLKTTPFFLRFGLSAIAALGAPAPLTAAYAVPLPTPGAGTTTAANPDLAGTILRDVVTGLTIATPGGAPVNFSIQDRVVKRKSFVWGASDRSKRYAAGRLLFDSPH